MFINLFWILQCRKKKYFSQKCWIVNCTCMNIITADTTKRRFVQKIKGMLHMRYWRYYNSCKTEGFKIVVTIFVIRFSNSFHHHFFLQMRKWKQNEKQPWPLIFVILLQTVWELLINSVLDVQFINAQQYFFSAMNNTFRVKSMLSALHWRFYRPTITMMKSINISKHLFFPSAKLCNSEC